jgi:hypothetical protein
LLLTGCVSVGDLDLSLEEGAIVVLDERTMTKTEVSLELSGSESADEDSIKATAPLPRGLVYDTGMPLPLNHASLLSPH